MNGTDEVRVENQNYYQGRNYALQSKTTGKKSHLLQNIIYTPKGNIYIYIYIYIYWNKQHLEIKVVWSNYPFLHY